MAKITNVELNRIKKLQDMDFTLPEARKEVFSLIELLCGIIMEQQHEIQNLKDEINRLKGEQGKPRFKAKKETKPTGKDRPAFSENKSWAKRSKNDRVKIDRTVEITLDKEELPPDAVFKGYEEKIVQNMLMKTDNVLYRLEKYYSPSLRKTYTAQVDESLRGKEFGPDLKALVSCLYYENRVTENKIASFLNGNGLHISEGTISNMLIKEQKGRLSEIKREIFEAGVNTGTYQQIDDTGMKIGGLNAYATIVCNERYSAFFINFRKNRETVKKFLTERVVSLFPVLVGDDAPQFKGIAGRYALCWVHEERHYKKLNPVFGIHANELERVRGEIWAYYKKLQEYKTKPSEHRKGELRHEFGTLFGQKTGYGALDDRLVLTMGKKEELLTVLDYPETPLHNNLSENGIREIVLKRKISGGVETEEGVRAWENNMSILATCKKLGVSFYEFMKGVFSKNIEINLAGLI